MARGTGAGRPASTSPRKPAAPVPLRRQAPATTRLSRANTVRLISSARLRPPALAPLADSEADLALLARLEGATSGRLTAEREGLLDLDRRELVFGAPNHSFINAAFAYARPGGNRFNDERRGAWYCGFEVATALAEVSWHLTRALADAGDAFDNVTDYAELVADFIGEFHDLRGASPRPRCLHPDPAIGYPAGQALAHKVRRDWQLPGIVYPSVRHPGGTCLAALRPSAVQNVRQGGMWRLTWSGSPEPRMERVG
jgi:hypothetical protein